jgi:hypothetical protein
MTALRRQRLVRHLHQLGERAVAELLAELGVERSIGTIIDEKLLRFSRLDPATLKALGAERIPPVPIHAVGNGGRT